MYTWMSRSGMEKEKSRKQVNICQIMKNELLPDTVSEDFSFTISQSTTMLLQDGHIHRKIFKLLSVTVYSCKIINSVP